MQIDPEPEPLLEAQTGPEAPRRSFGGPLLLLLPLAFFCASVLFLLRDRSAPAPDEPRAPREIQRRVPGWVGRLEGPGDLRVHARLTRLHAQAARQLYDRGALAARFGLAEGEPWRLALRVVSGGPPVELSLAGLVVEDAAGKELRPLPPVEPPPPGGIADPLAVVLAPPAVLGAGEEAQLVLWGPAPGAAPRLRGLALEGVADATLDVPLEPRTLEPGPDETALASLEVFARPATQEEEAGDEE